MSTLTRRTILASTAAIVATGVCLDGEMRGVLGARRRDLVTQYFADHTFLYRCNQNLPHSLPIPKSCNAPSSASASIACAVSGISVVTSRSRCRIVIANSAKGAVWTVVCNI